MLKALQSFQILLNMLNRVWLECNIVRTTRQESVKILFSYDKNTTKPLINIKKYIKKITQFRTTCMQLCIKLMLSD